MTELKYAYLALIGGLLYSLLEILWRGYTHWSMIIVGGVCFAAVMFISDTMPCGVGLLARGVCGAAVVTVLEFISGVILNLWLNMNVWDYSTMPMNILGQVCLPFSFAWVLLSIAAILIGNFLECHMFGEPSKFYSLL